MREFVSERMDRAVFEWIGHVKRMSGEWLNKRGH